MNATTLNALADPNRLRIIELLRGQPYSVGDIADKLWLRQPQVSKHLSVLSDAGLVVAQTAAQRRIYHLQPTPFKELDSWLATFKVIWEDRLSALDEYAQVLKKQ